ncbi:hypothetical protein Pelo_15098 [Pelomyxa schiedti]|nr:hypothetical protein Pelo_15098 [Pelomyxa schiedti]
MDPMSQLIERCRALLTIRETLGATYVTHKQGLLSQAFNPSIPPAQAAATLKKLFEIGFLDQNEVNHWTAYIVVGAPPPGGYPPSAMPSGPSMPMSPPTTAAYPSPTFVSSPTVQPARPQMVKYNMHGKHIKDVSGSVSFTWEGDAPAITVRDPKGRTCNASRCAKVSGAVDIFFQLQKRLTMVRGSYFNADNMGFTFSGYTSPLSCTGDAKAGVFQVFKAGQPIAKIEAHKGHNDAAMEIAQGEEPLVFLTILLVMNHYAKKFMSYKEAPPVNVSVSLERGVSVSGLTSALRSSLSSLNHGL